MGTKENTNIKPLLFQTESYKLNKSRMFVSETFVFHFLYNSSKNCKCILKDCTKTPRMMCLCFLFRIMALAKKEEGNKFYTSKEYRKAVDLYTNAIGKCN